ncbi:MAG: cation transporter [Ferruginibacter sp.]
MKRFLLVLIASAGLMTAANAQKTTDKAIFKTPVQNCEKCKEIIEFFLAKTDGVMAVKVDLKRQTTTVSWLVDRIDKETIKVTISGLGFAADDVEADEFAYKRLPACCKKPVETPKPAPPKG